MEWWEAFLVIMGGLFVLMFMGNSSGKMIGEPDTTEGERHDRCNLDLPGEQENLILKVAVITTHWINLVNPMNMLWVIKVRPKILSLRRGSRVIPKVVPKGLKTYQPTSQKS